MTSKYKEKQQILEQEQLEQDIKQQYIQTLINQGYIKEDLSPIKCQNCDGTDFEQVDIYNNDFCNLEYSLKCLSCNQIVGHWDYGYWEM